MTQPRSDSKAAHAGTGVRQAASAAWRNSFLMWPALILIGVAFAGTNRVGAREEETPPASFVKIGKNYINIARVTHIFDDPGQPLPPGTMSVCFSGGSQNYMNLYGEDATTFREAIARMTTELIPKASGEAAGSRKASPSGKKSVVPAPASAPPATPKKAAPPATSTAPD